MDFPEIDPAGKNKPELPERRMGVPAPTMPKQDYAYGSTETPVTTLFEYYRLMLRRKGTLLIAAILGIVLGLGISLPRTPMYQARTTLEIQGLNENLFNTREINPSAASSGTTAAEEIATQIKILQSDSLIERAVNKLKQQNIVHSGTAPGQLEKLRNAVNKLRKTPVASNDAAITTASQNVLVQTLPGGAHVIQILADSPDPDVAAAFVNVLANEYMDQRLESRLIANQRTSAWLNKQLGELRINLEDSEKRLQTYGQSAGLIFTSEKDSIAEQKMLQLQAELSAAQADRVMKQSRYEITKSEPAETLPQVLDDASLREIQAKLTGLRTQLADLNVTLTPANPKVERLRAQINEIQAAFERERANIVKRMANDYESARRREDLLLREYGLQTALVSEQSSKVTHYGLLKREVDTNRTLYEGLLQRVKEYGMASAITASNVRVVDAAKPPALPYKPDISMYSLLGLATGFFLGVLFIIWQEQADRSIHVPGEAPQYLKLPELGVILSAHADSTLNLRRWQLPTFENFMKMSRRISNGDLLMQYIRGARRHTRRHDAIQLVTSAKQFSLVAECFRTTAASILFSGHQGTAPNVFVVTSANPQDGKTTVVSNLSIALTETKRRVLVIDSDLRRPDLHRVFGLDNSWGLTDILHDDIDIDTYPVEMLGQQTAVPNLFVMTSGSHRTGLIHILHSKRMPDLLRRLRAEFDIVLIDSPPVLQIADARVVSRMSDGVVFVISSGKTTRDMAMGACNRFRQDGTRILGTILNRWDPRESDQHGYFGAYYEYYAYAKKE